MIRLCAYLRKYLYLIPIIQLTATFLLCFIDVDTVDFVMLGNSIGYSILTSLIYIVEFILNKKNYCLLTKASVFGVLILSIFNFIGSFYNDYSKYENDLTIISFSIIIGLVIIYRKGKIWE